MKGFNTSIKQAGKSVLQLKKVAITLYHLVVFSTALYIAGERFKHLQKTHRTLPLHLPEMGLGRSSPEIQFKVIQHTQKLLKLCDKTQCYQIWTLNCLPAIINRNPRSCYFPSSGHSLLEEWVEKTCQVDFQSLQNKTNYKNTRNMYNIYALIITFAFLNL